MSRPTLEDIADATWIALADVVGAGKDRLAPFECWQPAASMVHVTIETVITGTGAGTSTDEYYKQCSYNRRSTWAGRGWDGGGRLSRLGNVGIATIVYATSTHGESKTFTVKVHGHRIAAKLKWSIVTTDGGAPTTADDEATLSAATGWTAEITIEAPVDGSQELSDLTIIPSF